MIPDQIVFEDHSQWKTRNTALTQQPAADIFTVSGAQRNFIGNLRQPVKISKNPIES